MSCRRHTRRTPSAFLATVLCPIIGISSLAQEHDGELTAFLRWMTHTHTMRLATHYHTSGTGQLYQAQFKAFPVEGDDRYSSPCGTSNATLCAPTWSSAPKIGAGAAFAFGKPHRRGSHSCPLVPWRCRPIGHCLQEGRGRTTILKKTVSVAPFCLRRNSKWRHATSGGIRVIIRNRSKKLPISFGCEGRSVIRWGM